MQNHLRQSALVHVAISLTLIVALSGLDGKPLPAAEAPAGDTLAMLVEPQTLYAWLDDSSLPIRVLDVRPSEKYASGHIPGAVRVDVAPWVAKSHSPGGFHDTDYWAKAVGRLGITAETRVVVYSDSLTSAARVWWALRYVGLRDVALLDGGLKAWTSADLPTETDVPKIAPVSFRPHFQADRLSELDDLVQTVAAADSQVVILDARSADEYTGKVARGPRGGHIPGAIHLDWTELVAPDGRLKPRDQLRALFQSRGADPDAVVITHCQSGGRASVETFALELAGYTRVKHYYCGWKEWGAAAKAPVEIP